MKRALMILIVLSFFPLAFLPGDVSGFSPCSNSITPPFISTGVLPNILIILDNSNSFDEDFYGNAVGSYSPASKSVNARQALQQIVTELQFQANVGLMTFTLPNGDVSFYYVHNAMPFTSFNPNSYCANPPPDCVNYCTTGNATSKSNCEAACPGLTTTQYEICCTSKGSLFNSGFPDFLLDPTYGPYPFNEPTGTRANYCSLAYPKTNWMEIQDKSGNYVYMYWNAPDPFYDTTNDGIQFGYSGADDSNSGSYSTAQNAANWYAYYYNKYNYTHFAPPYVMADLGNNSTGVPADYSSYDTHYQFQPTDSDWALGFYNWGQKMPWYYVGPSWLSTTSPAGPTPPSVSGPFQGYLHVPVSALSSSTQFNNIYNILNPNIDTSVPIPNNTPYMSCTASNKNTCSYIVNAGNTPTAGALYSAYSYFNGTFSQNGTNYASPISSTCQKNYVILVTDGLPDTEFNGNMPTTTTQYCTNSSGQSNTQTCNGTTSGCSAPYNVTCSSAIMSQVLSQVYNLQSNVSAKISGQSYNFPVQTYVLGIGSEAPANANLNNMAIAGGTATPAGTAYYAGDATQLYDALESIITNLLGRVASGSSISILSEGQTQNGDNMLQGVFYPTKSFATATVSWPGYLYDWWFYNGTTNNGVSYNNIREDTVHDYILELNEDDGISFIFSPQTGLSVNRYSDPTCSGNPTTFVNNVTLDSLTPIWEAGKLLFEQTAASRQIYTPGSNANGSGLVNFNTSNTTLTSTTSSPLGSPSNMDPCLNGSLSNLINYVSGTDIKYCSNGTTFNYTACSQNSDCSGQANGYTSCVNACRNRTVGLCSSGTSFSNIPCATNSDCSGTSYPTCTEDVWKLGDIVYSTPRVQTNFTYCSIPGTTTFSGQACTADSNCATPPYTGAGSCQQKESVVFVGANDGMLHAFKTGILTSSGMTGPCQVETFTGIPDSAMGTELWAFIPQNSLPYLRCLASPPPSSCHLYYNDLSPYITTMIENGVSKTVLIGGMRLGGGSIQASTTSKYCFNSSGVSNGVTCASPSGCNSPYNSSCSPAYPTNVPADTCSGGGTSTTGFIASSNPAICASSPCTISCSSSYPTTCYQSSCTGLSSYYALDITDPENPKLLWEFSHPFLGYTFSGPAVIHKWNTSTSTDQYYVMFLSGPTGASDGSSVQDVQAFVLTLNPATLGISNVYYRDLGEKDGFGGRLFTNGLSVSDPPYTDFVFFGYSSAPSGVTGNWTGGIGVLNANFPDPVTSLNPASWNWDLSTYANIATLPITAQVAPGICFGNTYLFAGTGRYFFPQDNYGQNSGLNYLMGIPFVRYCMNGSASNNQTCSQNSGCTTGLFTSCVTAVPTAHSLNQNTTACSALQANPNNTAWIYDLDAASADGTFLAERMVTDPTVPVIITPPNVSNNITYFVTAEPTSNPCGYGGQSRVWGFNCATGGAITDQSCTNYAVSNTSGTLYLQTSTGAINTIDNSTSFTAENQRATPFVTGMPPENAAPSVQPATVAARGGLIMQWIER